MQSDHFMGCKPTTAIGCSHLLPANCSRRVGLKHECLQFSHSIKFGSLEKTMSTMCGTFRAAANISVYEEEGQQQETKLWSGRFEKPVTPALEKFSQPVSYDKQLYKQDLTGSRAHAQMLAKQGLMIDEDCATI